MAGEVVKENLLLLSNVSARQQLISLNATGFAFRTKTKELLIFVISFVVLYLISFAILFNNYSQDCIK